MARFLCLPSLKYRAGYLLPADRVSSQSVQSDFFGISEIYRPFVASEFSGMYFSPLKRTNIIYHEYPVKKNFQTKR